MVRKGLGTKRFDQKKKKGQEAVWAKSGVGQKWSEKQKKTWKKQAKEKEYIPLPFTQNKK